MWARNPSVSPGARRPEPTHFPWSDWAKPSFRTQSTEVLQHRGGESRTPHHGGEMEPVHRRGEPGRRRRWRGTDPTGSKTWKTTTATVESLQPRPKWIKRTQSDIKASPNPRRTPHLRIENRHRLTGTSGRSSGPTGGAVRASKQWIVPTGPLIPMDISPRTQTSRLFPGGARGGCLPARTTTGGSLSCTVPITFRSPRARTRVRGSARRPARTGAGPRATGPTSRARSPGHAPGAPTGSPRAPARTAGKRDTHDYLGFFYRRQVQIVLVYEESVIVCFERVRNYMLYNWILLGWVNSRCSIRKRVRVWVGSRSPYSSSHLVKRHHNVVNTSGKLGMFKFSSGVRIYEVGSRSVFGVTYYK